MVNYDFHFFSPDALPLVLQFLKDKGFKVSSYKGIYQNQAPFIESSCPDGYIRLKVKYHV